MLGQFRTCKARLYQVRSGYSRLGHLYQFKTSYVWLFQMRSAYDRLHQVMSV
jgi:hypothetical protein